MNQDMLTNIEASWASVLKKELETDYFKSLLFFLNQQINSYTVYPALKNVFKAFELTPFNKVKVIIIGQDPYHGKGQAQGLSFSVPTGMRLPPSLKNIYKELEHDIGKPISQNGNLSHWAEQGVLLLNATLTVREGTPGSHQGKGWELFTDSCIGLLSEKKEGLIFILWGNFAKQKELLIDNTKHFVLKGPHPSPFSAHKGFFGCGHFSQTNKLLAKQNKTIISW